MNNSKNLPQQLRLCRRESLTTIQFNKHKGRRSLMVLLIILIIVEQELMKMNPDNIIDRTLDLPDVRYDFLFRKDPDIVQYYLVIAIEQKNFLSCLTISRSRNKRPTLEIIEEITKDIMEGLKK